MVSGLPWKVIPLTLAWPVIVMISRPIWLVPVIVVAPGVSE